MRRQTGKPEVSLVDWTPGGTEKHSKSGRRFVEQVLRED